ncbi:RsfA family transcriptional regulator [Litchfieldia alkalitelluris]|uniref:RsfA family transcriptional regulator n=1 Tax=Litchfieldia alkalitelluris TaxID=304268 RepID=UPI001F178847|nr:RsfA family transcriptional regulator [Litchfieldia alkalitelluris]
MIKERQDAWTEENDLLLAETVLRHVREGSTQLNAFDEVGDELNRTSAACGFRWNAVVRHNYEKALQLAKKQRKQRQRALGQHQPVKKKLLYTPPVPSLDSFEEHIEVTDYEKPVINENPTAFSASITKAQLTIDQVISFLSTMQNRTSGVSALQKENERLKRENKEIAEANKALEQKVEQLEKKSLNIQEDYETLMKIMNRARKLVLFEEEERPSTKFKMDRNGNLEKVAE